MRGRAWTEEEMDYLREHEGDSQKALCDALDRTWDSIRNKISYLHAIDKPEPKHLTCQEVEGLCMELHVGYKVKVFLGRQELTWVEGEFVGSYQHILLFRAYKGYYIGIEKVSVVVGETRCRRL